MKHSSFFSPLAALCVGRLRVPLSPSPAVLEIYLVLWQRCCTPTGSRVCDPPISLRDIYTRSDSVVTFLSRLRINRQLYQHSRKQPRWRLEFSSASTTYTPLILSKYMQRIFSRTFLEISIATRAFSDLHRHSRLIDRYTLACSMQIIHRLQYACTAHCSIEIRATDSRFSLASEPVAVVMRAPNG
uniref:Secreted protein n=1 Tax=Trichogramma kaykai TaxID=54128 RepID=A0ABD2W4T8_9HYME